MLEPRCQSTRSYTQEAIMLLDPSIPVSFPTIPQIQAYMPTSTRLRPTSASCKCVSQQHDQETVVLFRACCEHLGPHATETNSFRGSPCYEKDRTRMMWFDTSFLVCEFVRPFFSGELFFLLVLRRYTILYSIMFFLCILS